MKTFKNILVIAIPIVVLVLVSILECSMFNLSYTSQDPAATNVYYIIAGIIIFAYLNLKRFCLKPTDKVSVWFELISIALVIIFVACLFAPFKNSFMYSAMGTMFLLATIFVLSSIGSLIMFAHTKKQEKKLKKEMEKAVK